ncbi:MAG: MarR family winged helix-turn-helix transcriptional regulator [Actinomycetota bacterium]
MAQRVKRPKTAQNPLAESSGGVLSADTLRVSGALLSAQTALGRLIDTDAVEPTGQDPTTVDLLVRLDQAPGHRLRAVELSRQLLMSPSHISRTIDRAEAAGLVERATDPDDRRASLVVLTAEGRRTLEDFAPRLEALIDRVIGETLTRAEADSLIELLGRIERASASPPGGSGS